MSVEYVTRAELHEALAPLATRVELQEVRTELKGDIRVLSERMDAQFTDVRSDITGIRSDIVEMRSDIVEIRSDIVEIRSDIVEIRRDIVEIRSDIVEIRSDIVEMRGDIAELRSGFKELRGEFVELRHHFDLSVEAFRTEVRAIAEICLATNASVDKLRRAVKKRFRKQDERIDRIDADVYLLKQRAHDNGGGMSTDAALAPSSS